MLSSLVLACIFLSFFRMGMVYHFGCMWCIDTLHTTVLGFGCDHAVNMLVVLDRDRTIHISILTFLFS